MSKKPTAIFLWQKVTDFKLNAKYRHMKSFNVTTCLVSLQIFKL